MKAKSIHNESHIYSQSKPHLFTIKATSIHNETTLIHNQSHIYSQSKLITKLTNLRLKNEINFNWHIIWITENLRFNLPVITSRDNSSSTFSTGFVFKLSVTFDPAAQMPNLHANRYTSMRSIHTAIHNADIYPSVRDDSRKEALAVWTHCMLQWWPSLCQGFESNDLQPSEKLDEAWHPCHTRTGTAKDDPSPLHCIVQGTEKKSLA